MKYFIICIMVFSSASCKEIKSEKTEQRVESEIVAKVNVEDLEEESIFASHDSVLKMILGSWSNSLDPNSVVIFKEKTTSNMYQDVIVQDNITYNISTNCKNEVAAKSTEIYRYINTNGAYPECYYITTLDTNTLVMEFEKGDITLTFNRLNGD